MKAPLAPQRQAPAAPSLSGVLGERARAGPVRLGGPATRTARSRCRHSARSAPASTKRIPSSAKRAACHGAPLAHASASGGEAQDHRDGVQARPTPAQPPVRHAFSGVAVPSPSRAASPRARAPSRAARAGARREPPRTMPVTTPFPSASTSTAGKARGGTVPPIDLLDHRELVVVDLRPRQRHPYPLALTRRAYEYVLRVAPISRPDLSQSPI